MSLYDELGGDAALATGLDRVYEKVMVDPRVNLFFEGVNLDRLKVKQRAFLAMAFGGPANYDGRDLREAHRSAVMRGLDEATFDVFMGHFRDTLEELGAKRENVQEVMDISYGARDEVLNR